MTMHRAYSRAVSVLFQTLFAIWGALGVAGMAWLLTLHNRRVDRPETTLISLFAVLFAAVIASAVAGVMHMRSKNSRISEDSWPITGVDNMLGGLTVLLFAGSHIVLTGLRSRDSEHWSYLSAGAIIFGLFLEIYGATRLARRRRTSALQEHQLAEVQTHTNTTDPNDYAQ